MNNSQSITTIIPPEYVDDWKSYADGGKIEPEGSATTWAADYVKSGVDLKNRLLVTYVDPTAKKPTIESVSVGETTTSSIEVIVAGENLNGGTITVVLSNDVTEVSRTVLDDFGGHIFGNLTEGTDYTVYVTAVNKNGSTVADPLTTGTYGTTDLAARLYYVKSSQVANFVYDTVDRSRSANILQFDMGATGGTRGWLTTDKTLIDGFNPLTVVFDVSFKNFKATDLSFLFNKMSALTTIDGIENLDTSECTTMMHMFYHIDAMTAVDLSGFKTAKVTNMNSMFQWSGKIKTIYANDNFITSGIQLTANLFEGDGSLVGGNGTAYSKDHKLADYAVVDTAETPGYFTYKAPPPSPPTIESVTASGISLNTATITVVGNYLQGGTVTVKLLVGGVEKKELTHDAFGTFEFEGLSDSTAYDVLVEAENYAGTSTDESCSFKTWGYTTLAARAVYTESDRTMTFYYDNIDRAGVAKWSVDFGEDGARTWGTPKGTSWETDHSIGRIVIDSSFAAYRPKTCHSWFIYLRNNNQPIEMEGIRYLNTSEVTDMSLMFYNFVTAGVDLTGFNTKKVTTFEQMFGYAGWQVMDLSSFDTRSATNMYQMFVGTGSTTTIYACERFVTTAVKNGDQMFTSCWNLVGQNGTRPYEAGTKTPTGKPLDYTYAVVDTAETPGYFTYKAYSGLKGLMVYPR